MSKYAVSEEGVHALKTMASNILNAIDQILNMINSIEPVADEYVDTLGPHHTSLVSAITEIREAQKQAVQPASELSESLNDVADAYQDIIDNDKVSVGNNGKSTVGSSHSGGNGSGNKGGKVASFFGRIFGGAGSVGSQFGQFNVDSHGFVKGNGYDSYINDWNSYGSAGFETDTASFEGINVTETIDPSSIEGIRVSENDIKAPGIFWGQHKTGGTAESFKEVASHIPEVKSELDKGRSLFDLENDPVLGPCASIYFDPQNMVQVIKCDGYYEFQSNGRHRVLAARETGYKIPVKIIGKRTRK